ncbi:unnamed protein product, partial [Ectocarpus fasciculatus]
IVSCIIFHDAYSRWGISTAGFESGGGTCLLLVILACVCELPTTQQHQNCDKLAHFATVPVCKKMSSLA